MTGKYTVHNARRNFQKPYPQLGDPFPKPAFFWARCVAEIGNLLIDASTRTQLIVTTHSDVIVNALSDMPESVFVCEKHDGKTEIQRLNAEEVEPFWERYKLGELWINGGIGGTRW